MHSAEQVLSNSYDGDNGAIRFIDAGSGAIKAALKTITSAGTREQLPDYPCNEVTLIGLRANTGYVFIGGSDVSSTIYGVELAAKDSITIKVSNTNLIWLDVSVSGEGISYVAV